MRPFVGACNHCSKWRTFKRNVILPVLVKGYITLCRSISNTPIKSFYENQTKIAEQDNNIKKKAQTNANRKKKMTFLDVLQEANDYPVSSESLVFGGLPQHYQQAPLESTKEEKKVE